MSYWSSATYTVSSKEQIEAAKHYDYHSVLIPEQKLEDIMKTDDMGLCIKFEGLTCDDFDTFIPAFSKYLAKAVPEDHFSCKDALCEYSVSFSEIHYKVIYENRHLIIKSLHEGDGWDETWGFMEDMEGIAVLPPYKYIHDFDQFVSEVSEDFECNMTDQITEETDFIVTNLEPDDYSEEIKEAIENGAEVVTEEAFLNGFELWKYTPFERPWVIDIEEDI